MFQLLEILRKNRFGVLFVVLQMISLILLFNQNTFHRISFLNTTGVFVGGTYSAKQSITNYLHLTEKNNELLNENNNLRNEIEFLKSQIDEDFVCGNTYDSLLSVFDNRFSLKPAKIIHLSKNGKDLFLTINKGRNDGVRKDMGIIGTEGILGKVLFVSGNYSILMSTNNSNFFTNVRINNAVGSLYWNGEQEDYSQISSITKHSDIQVGDSVFTSNLSTIFPEDIFIGTIEKVEVNPSEQFLEIDVKMASKTKGSKYAHYIEDDYWESKNQLLDSVENVY
jgi:rod shape-determining protein MreC